MKPIFKAATKKQIDKRMDLILPKKDPNVIRRRLVIPYFPFWGMWELIERLKEDVNSAKIFCWIGRDTVGKDGAGQRCPVINILGHIRYLEYKQHPSKYPGYSSSDYDLHLVVDVWGNTNLKFSTVRYEYYIEPIEHLADITKQRFGCFRIILI